jgi:hypothetical protein
MQRDARAGDVGFQGDGITAGLGWVEVAVGVLHDVLHVPENAEIVGAEFKYPGVVRLLFTAPELSHDEGEIPTVNPTITHERWTWDWNL